MHRCRTIFFAVFLILFLTGTGCGKDFRNITGESTYIDNSRSDIEDTYYTNNKALEEGETGNILPVAVIKAYQQGAEDEFFIVGNRVYFSAGDSIDADGDALSFRWQIDNMGTLTGEEISYIFNEPGEYIIELIVSDGSDTVTVSKKIYLSETESHFLIKKSHEATVNMEYIITNNGPEDIEDIICLIQVPQTYRPFQIIKSYKSNYNKMDEIYSDDYNVIARFNMGNLSAGESASAYVNCVAELCEYEYERLEDEISIYEPSDRDLSLYTKDEYYIDSNSRQIQSIVDAVAGEETVPVKIAEKLYNYVTNRMEYDEKRLTSGAGSYSYASEILQRGKGVCTDYSILYIALCRAAGIPAKFVQGIPVFSILTDGQGSLPYAHAWVEIKLPVYGWVPIDVTTESGFMAYNYYLNMETYKGSGVFYRSLSVDGLSCYPSGFYYSWKGDTEPDVSRETSYSVSGVYPGSISMVSESEFLDGVGEILYEYSAVINHINSMHAEELIFNDPQEISIEETFLSRLIELSGELERIDHPESYTEDRNNLLEISYRINLHKEEQIKCMKDNNYECTMNENTLFIDSLNELFDYYNNMIGRFNLRY
jgi:transglutaminase-like putative cysteine protease